MVLPYMKGVMERLQKACKKCDIHLFCKAGYAIKNVVIWLKDLLDPEENCVYMGASGKKSVVSCMWARQRDL